METKFKKVTVYHNNCVELLAEYNKWRSYYNFIEAAIKHRYTDQYYHNPDYFASEFLHIKNNIIISMNEINEIILKQINLN